MNSSSIGVTRIPLHRHRQSKEREGKGGMMWVTRRRKKGKAICKKKIYRQGERIVSEWKQLNWRPRVKKGLQQRKPRWWIRVWMQRRTKPFSHDMTMAPAHTKRTEDDGASHFTLEGRAITHCLGCELLMLCVDRPIWPSTYHTNPAFWEFLCIRLCKRCARVLFFSPFKSVPCVRPTQTVIIMMIIMIMITLCWHIQTRKRICTVHKIPSRRHASSRPRVVMSGASE